MVPNSTNFRWTTRSEAAVALVAQDMLSDVEIAASLKIGRETLSRWKRHPAFRERAQGIVTIEREALQRKGITERQNRLDAYNQRWLALATLIAERGAAPDMQGVPGGATGLLLRTIKGLGRGVMVEEYAVDTATLRALLDLEKQAAIEMGQWEERSVASGGVRITVEYADAPTAATPALPRVRLIESGGQGE